MNWDSLLSFFSIYLCTVLVYLLKERFFTTETLRIDRIDVMMRATVLALFPNEYMMQDIITVVEHMYQDITGIILPIANIVSDRMTEVSDIVIMITNFLTPDNVYWIIIIIMTRSMLACGSLLIAITDESII